MMSKLTHGSVGATLQRGRLASPQLPARSIAAPVLSRVGGSLSHGGLNEVCRSGPMLEFAELPLF
jgi:hypothetical protein